jgi:hypothetical protein
MSEIVHTDAKRYPLFATERGMVLLTVLTRRTEGKFKAYAAIVPDVSATDPDYNSVKTWVQANGNALLFREAHAIWPLLLGDEKRYAR